MSAEGVKPPLSKRGAVTPANFDEKRRQGVDYLTFTLPSYPQRLLGGLKEFIFCYFGSSGEERSWKHNYRGWDVAGTGEFLIRPAPRRHDAEDDGPIFDVLLNLPARALDTLRGRGLDDRDIIQNAVNAGLRCCRIDLAIDSYDKRIHPGLARKAALDSAYTGRSMNDECIQSGKKGKIRKPGERMTVTFGARSGAFFFRVYDKQGQIEDRAGVKMDHCTRFEMEVKGNREKVVNEDGVEVMQAAAAELIAAQYVKEGPSCIPEIFESRINFVKLGTASRVERCDLIWWWKCVIGKAQGEPLGLQRGIATPESSLQWFEKSVAPTVAVALKTGQGDRIRGSIAAAVVTQSAAEKWKEFTERTKKANEYRRAVEQKRAEVVTPRGPACLVPVSEVRPQLPTSLFVP